MTTSLSREDLRARLSASPWKAFLSGYLHSVASVLVMSGFWTLLYVPAAIVSSRVSKHLEARRPRMLVLRRFRDAGSEEFLRIAIGGLSAYAKPLWLYDETDAARQHLRRHLPNLWLYVARMPVWIMGMCAIVWDLGHDHSGALRVLWIAWMLVGSTSYHRFQAGEPLESWLATVSAAVATLLLAGPATGTPLSHASWLDAIWVVLIFVAVKWAFRLLSCRRPLAGFLRRWRERRWVRELSDVEQFKREGNGERVRHRYLKLTPIYLDEVVCTSETWAASAYEAIGFSSIALADITGVENSIPLQWEIDQARIAWLPLVFTCEANALRAALSTPSLNWLSPSQVVTWSRVQDFPRQTKFDAAAVSAAFFGAVGAHQRMELRYRPIRPKREDATDDLRCRVVRTSVQP